MTIRKAPTTIRALLPLANAFLIMGILWERIYHPATQAGREWSEALCGLAFGLSIAINLIVGWRCRHRRGCAATGGEGDVGRQ